MRLVTALKLDPADLQGPARVDQYQLPEGFVFVVDDDMSVVAPILDYLVFRFLNIRKSQRVGNTQRSHAEDLYEWWQFLIANKVRWFAVKREHLEQFRDIHIYGISPHTGRPYATSTVIRRLSTIFSFYRWVADFYPLLRPAKHSSIPQREPSDRDLQRIGQLCSPSGRRRVYPKTHGKADIRAIAEENLRAIFFALGPKPSESSDLEEFEAVRNRLASEVAHNTGARIHEVCALTCTQVNNLMRQAKADRPIVWLRLTRTKGLHERDVPISRRLLKELVTYVTTHRQVILDRCAAKGKRFLARNRDFIFLNGVGCTNRDIGRPLRTHQLESAFKKAVLSCGLTTQVAQNDKRTKQTKSTAFRLHVFQDLRHTFALRVYRKEIEHGNTDPWKVVQVLLGHRDIATTQNIYGRSVSVDEVALGELMESSFEALVK